MNEIFKNLKKMFLFAEAEPLIQKARRGEFIQAEDALELPLELEPHSSPLQTVSLDLGSGKTLMRDLWQALKFPYLKGFALFLFSQLLSLLSPWMIHGFITRLEASSGTAKGFSEMDGGLVALAVGIALSGYLSGWMLQRYFYRTLKLQQIVIARLNHLVFRKSLRLSLRARASVQSGDVVNLMSSDSESLSDAIFVTSQFFVYLVLIVGSFVLLFQYFGLATWASILSLLVLVPISRKIGKKLQRADEEMMKFRDDRVTLVGQIMTAIRLVKSYAWEKGVLSEVEKVRAREVKERRQVARQESLSGMIFLASTSLVLLVTLATFAALGNPISLSLVFAGLSLFAILEEPMGEMTSLVSRWVSASVSAERLVQFLRLEENVLPKSGPLNEKSPAETGVELSQVTVEGPAGENLLSDLSLQIIPGEKVAVIGAVGAGKSVFLQALLGELKVSQGKIRFSGEGIPPEKISYVPQESFLLNGSLEENICFGNSGSQGLTEVLRLSQLDKDIQNFQLGLKTEIGERGINLSGGQKQRVSLARAMYQQGDLILLDDAFSALDPQTEKILFSDLICGHWREKTLIFATHRLGTLAGFDKVLFLRQGKMIFFGPPQEMMTQDFFQNFALQESQGGPVAEEPAGFPAASAMEGETSLGQVLVSEGALTEKATKIISVENRKRGGIQQELFLSYVHLLGGQGPTAQWVLGALFFGAIFSKLLPLLQKYWLSFGQGILMNHEVLSVGIFLGIYAGLGFLTLLAFYGNNLFWFHRGILAADCVHRSALTAVLRSPISYFNSTPVGRILQRFSRDQESLDLSLMFSHIAAIDCLIQMLVATGVILISIPEAFFAVLPILGIYFFVQRDYRSAAREIKRLDSIARSPRYAHFKETLMAWAALRAHRQESWFEEQFFQRLRESQKMFYSHYMVNRWFSVRIPLLGAGLVLAASLGVLYFSQTGRMSVAGAGMVLIYSMSFWRYLNWGVRIYSDIEVRMTSVERLQELCQLPAEELPMVKESDKNLSANKVDPQSLGKIRFENVSVRYREDLPWVLNHISFEIHAGERVGIVGRTGSGKSTLLQALYRFVKIEKGRILIDDQDISSQSLESLRRSLAIIPQDPTLFMGTLRSNLDRYEEYSDEEIWRVLEITELADWVQRDALGLAMKIRENGFQLSLGQRQLLCLARALLVGSRILILDEATASVDVETDQKIQKVLRNQMKGVTQIIIAHRLETITDCDQILEINKGRLLEKKSLTAAEPLGTGAPVL